LSVLVTKSFTFYLPAPGFSTKENLDCVKP
jgi:hypothetical protein